MGGVITAGGFVIVMELMYLVRSIEMIILTLRSTLCSIANMPAGHERFGSRKRCKAQCKCTIKRSGNKCFGPSSK